MITTVFMVIAKTVIYSNDGSCPINSNKAIINGYIYLTQGLIPIPVLIRFWSHCDTICNTAMFVRWGRFGKVNNVFLTIITKTESIFRLMKSISMTIQMNITEKYFAVVGFILQYNAVKYDQSTKSSNVR